MTLAEFLIQVTRYIYLLIGVLSLIDFARRRNRTQLDISLLFGTLGLIVGVQEFIALTGLRPIWLVKFMQISLMAHPYLMLRVVEHFRPISTRVRWFALAGMLASWLILILLTELSPPLNVGLVIYFAIVETYSVAAFVRGALTTGGVTRWRLGLTAAGSAMIAAVMILAGVNAVVPTLSPYTALPIQTLAVFSGLSYYLGLSPTRWMRRAWQLNELYSFLREAAGKPAAERGETMLAHLCATAVRTTGGRAAMAALWDAERQQLIIRSSTHPAMAGTISTSQGATGRAWQTLRPALARNVTELAPDSAQLAATIQAQALMAIPIITVEHTWGVLVVLLQRSSLFPDDDMDLLALFAEQSALALEQAQLLNEQKTLLGEQQKLVEQLRERTGQLEESNNELEAFSYSVSHDLRAPLRHIEGFTDFLAKADAVTSDEKSLRYLTLISEAAKRMGRLIDNLLTFSRLGRSALTVTLVDLSSMLEEVRQELHLETQGREIVWKVGQLPRVHCDPELMRLVLINLLSNAIKYTRPRTPAQIEVENVGGQMDGVVICVRDNGVGFDMEYADKLFGVFQRLHHNDEFEGTGIGLANVRRIVHRHGGRTWAEGVPGQGASFYFSLPSASIQTMSHVASSGQLRSNAFLFASPITPPGNSVSNPPP